MATSHIDVLLLPSATCVLVEDFAVPCRTQGDNRAERKHADNMGFADAFGHVSSSLWALASPAVR